MTTWVGASITRLEDEHFLTGDTRFVDDLSRPGLLHVAIVRSPVASAAFDEVDTSDARTAPGVVAVLTAGDLAHTNPLRPVLHRPQFIPTEMPLLAIDRVRYVGEPVALVLAETRSAAKRRRSGVGGLRGEVGGLNHRRRLDRWCAGGSRRRAGNVLLDLTMFHDPALEDVLSGAAVVVEGVFDAGRVTAAPMEGRGLLAEWDRRRGG